MNVDSGDNVDQHVKAVDAEGKELPKEAPDTHNDENDHLDPTRWWFASAAFPMIAGTLGPVASAFSICALVKPWRQFYPPGSDITVAPFVGDPIWLTIINAIQLVIAVISNLALLLNMTQRLRFSIAQPVTIVGWYISSITLVALTATAAGPLVIEPKDQFVWSQAFFYAIYSAVIYFVVASLMVVTFFGALAGRYEKNFMLTASQRTLMLQTISFLIYLLIGALVFCNIEDWDYLDATYWAAVTLFTVGFGDLYPTTPLARALLFPYSLVGIISLGLVIGSIRSLALERGKHRLDARMMERKRRDVLRRMTLKGKDDILKPIRDQQGTPSLHSGEGTGLTELERREQEFKLMRKIQQVAARRRRWYAMAISGSTWVVLWLLGAKVFQECEFKYQGWNYFDGVYFAFVSLTTIGYGDITPVSNAGRSFWVFWAFIALPTTTVLISNAGDTIVKGIRDTTDQIANITILPGERGFKKDFRSLLRKLSFGRLFEEDIEEEPPGFLGDLPRASVEDEDEDNDEEDGGIESSLQKEKMGLEAEAAGTLTGKVKKALPDKDEDVHNKRVAANTEAEHEQHPPSGDAHISFSEESSQRPRTARSSHSPSLLRLGKSDSMDSSTRSLHARNSSNMLKMSRAVSFPRQDQPEIPTNKADYHVTLIEEIGRVIQHLKSHPPRKYTFQEWAWYLRLIGEDESNAEIHKKAEHTAHLHAPYLRRRKTMEKEEGSESHGESEREGGGKKKQWSWVGVRSPLMGSQEEAEWILEKLTERLRDELREDARFRKRGQRRRSTVIGLGV